MASNPYSYMLPQTQDEEPEDPWSTYEPWSAQMPQMPTYTPADQSSQQYTWGGGNPYTVGQNVDSDGEIRTYPSPWGLSSPYPTNSPIWGGLTLPTRGTPATGDSTTGTTGTTGTGGTGGTSNPDPGATLNPAVSIRTGNAPVTGSATDNVITPDQWDYWNLPDQGLKALQTWASVNLPMLQLAQNTYQADREFSEAQRRWDIEQPWNMQLDQYNAQLASRQQQMAELQAQVSGNQWEREYVRQQQNDLFAQQLATEELALAQEQSGRELDLAERQQVWLETYQTASLEIQKQEIAAQLEAARYGTFGRNQAPSRWVAQWA